MAASSSRKPFRLPSGARSPAGSSAVHDGPPPSALLLALELRAFWEFGALLPAWPVLARAPQGDGHAVMVFPGLSANDVSTLPLRYYVRSRGYSALGWEQGFNFGPRAGVLDQIRQRLVRTFESTGRKVSLIGWSLGGVFALYGAHQALGCVRQLITLGSPVTVDAAGSQSPKLVQAMYRLIAHPMGPDVHVMQPRAKKLREHVLPPVPMSCLYSISDGVVPPQEATVYSAADAAVDGTPGCENIRVSGSHTGLGFNPMVMAILADRLAQPEQGWKPFQPLGWPGTVYRALTHAAVPL